MAAPKSIKHSLISKANTTIVAVTASACFVVVFSLVASWTLFHQLTYQNKVISEKKTTLKQIKSDLAAVKDLKTSYNAFINTPTNLLGGNPQGSGPKDGDNAALVLDALPSRYDFPALATTLETILTGQNVQIQSITGTDDSLNSSASNSSPTPTAQPMPFELSVTGNYGSIQSVISTFEHSIRPFQIQTIEVSGSSDQNQIVLTLTAQTFYQPAKSLNLSTKVVK